MGIYRGAGGTGDAVNDASSEAVLVQQLAVEAQADADAAAASATAAAGSASTASTQATSATNSATAAASSASSASSSASTATTQATNASNSATAAQTAETAAELAETNAETAQAAAASSASAASSSASTASTQATNASNSATAASTSATNASNSATAASTSASNASTSATNAASSASSASTSASNASTSATNASNSATSASTSATTATTQAGIATTKAGEAATSATNASNSASAASTSATNASNSASAAAGSATTASSAADAALAALDSFDDRYLGQKSTAPTVDNDGNALVAGALYFNTTTNEMKVYDGSTWLNAYASLSGALLATSNLSDLNNTATARTNLGVAIGTNVQAWDADLDTWATKTAPSGTVVGTSDSQTLTNKTLTTPVISSITNTGTLTLPTSTDTLVGRATTDTLTNKTIALGSNTVSGTLTQFNTAVTDADLVSLAGTETLTNKTLTSPVVTGGSINNTPIGASTASTGAFTTLSATGVTTVQAGTVSLPAITTTGDTNTGIFFPAADTIAFTEGGVESMRITSAGLVGIATSNPGQRLHVEGSISVNTGTSPGTNGSGIAVYASDFPRLSFRNSTTGDTSSDGLQIFMSGADVVYALQETGYQAWNTSSTERMRIDSSGNVGIGISAPTANLHVKNSIAIENSGSFATLEMGGASGAFIDMKTPFSDDYDFRIQLTSSLAILTTPTAIPITFATNDSERMRIDSSGNVGIGTASNSYTAAGRGNLNIAGSSSAILGFQISSAAKGYIFHNGTDLQMWNEVAGANVFGTNGLERMRIDSSGKVLVGATTAPSGGSMQMLLSNNAGAGIQLNNTTGVNGGAINSNGGNGLIFFGYSGAIGSETYSERMRITSGGAVAIGTTTAGAKLHIDGVGGTNNQSFRFTGWGSGIGAAGEFAAANTSNADVIYFRTSAAEVGKISITSTSTSYVTSSDYRLKENIAPMQNALNVVQQLKPCTYTWKSNGSAGQGFIAHELQSVVPDAVTGEKDAVDIEGNPKYQGIDTSFLVATLTAALQELNAKVEAQAAEIALLKSK